MEAFPHAHLGRILLRGAQPVHGAGGIHRPGLASLNKACLTGF